MFRPYTDHHQASYENSKVYKDLIMLYVYWDFETDRSVLGQYTRCTNTLTNTRDVKDPVRCYKQQSSIEFKNNKYYYSSKFVNSFYIYFYIFILMTEQKFNKEDFVPK